MRKQTKLVAVLSTAALLAIGASMTSFAAQGWAEEDGTWVYYDKNGDKVSNEWKKSGDNWYYLDDNGEMTVDELIEDDDNYYYVDANGAMVTNQWVAVENEDAGEEDEPDHYWYYFQANGKAYKRSDSASENTVVTKVINGKKYAFDTEGKMLYGWVSGADRETGDDAWKQDNALWYFGDEDDGAMSVGWRLIHIVDDDFDSAGTQPDPEGDVWDDEQDRWFYFQSSGKKKAASSDDGMVTKTINGKKYGFDQYGRMVSEWYTKADPTTDKIATGSHASGTASSNNAQGASNYSNSFMYFRSPEDGARYTKGWFKVTPGYYLQKGKYDDGDEYWYYADGDGKIYANSVEKIKGKKYAFDEYGRMINGLVFLQFDDEISNTIIGRYEDDNADTGRYDTEDDFDAFVKSYADEINEGTIRCYYFGNSDDGSMKTGKQTVDIDGDNFTFKFRNSGALKGAGYIGIDDKKLYMAGKQVKADKDDKYNIYKVTTKVAGQETCIVEKVDTAVFLKDENLVTKTRNAKDDAWVYTVKADAYANDVFYYLVNTSGSLVKSKSGAKDGDSYKFEVDKNYKIKTVTLED